MFREKARTLALMILLLGTISAAFLLSTVTSVSAEEVQFNDYADILDEYDAETRRYGNLDAGDTAVFTDTVIASNYIEGTVEGELRGETKVWIESTPGEDPLRGSYLPGTEPVAWIRQGHDK